MKTLFVVLGFVASILAVILAVTPLFKIGYIPALTALVFGLIAFYIARKNNLPRKSVHLVFLLTIMAVVVSTYKTIFVTVEVSDTEELIQKEDQSEQEAIETLEDIDIEE
jgi:membrane protein implicated in regulation of membrane protease activity